MTDAGVVAVVLALLDFAIKVLALGLLPQNRRPSSATAWLLLVLFLPVRGHPGVPADRQQVGRPGAPPDPPGGQRVRRGPRRVPGGRRDARDPAGGAAWLRSATYLNQHLGTLPCHRGQRRDAAAGLRGVDRRDDRRGRRGAAVRQRRVLHHGLGRRDGTVLRGAAPRPLRRGVEVRVLFDHLATPGHPRLQGHAPPLRRRRLPVAPDAAAAAAQGALAPPRPAQPPQDPGGRRRVAFTGSQNLIEPSYNKPKHQQGRAEWRGAHGPADAARW